MIVAVIMCGFVAGFSGTADAKSKHGRYGKHQTSYVTYYYPKRGYIAVMYPDGNVYYLRTYRDRESRDMNDVVRKGAIDLVTLGLFGTL